MKRQNKAIKPKNIIKIIKRLWPALYFYFFLFISLSIANIILNNYVSLISIPLNSLIITVFDLLNILIFIIFLFNLIVIQFRVGFPSHESIIKLQTYLRKQKLQDKEYKKKIIKLVKKVRGPLFIRSERGMNLLILPIMFLYFLPIEFIIFQIDFLNLSNVLVDWWVVILIIFTILQVIIYKFALIDVYQYNFNKFLRKVLDKSFNEMDAKIHCLFNLMRKNKLKVNLIENLFDSILGIYNLNIYGFLGAFLSEQTSIFRKKHLINLREYVLQLRFLSTKVKVNQEFCDSLNSFIRVLDVKIETNDSSKKKQIFYALLPFGLNILNIIKIVEILF